MSTRKKQSEKLPILEFRTIETPEQLKKWVEAVNIATIKQLPDLQDIWGKSQYTVLNSLVEYFKTGTFFAVQKCMGDDTLLDVMQWWVDFKSRQQFEQFITDEFEERMQTVTTRERELANKWERFKKEEKGVYEKEVSRLKLALEKHQETIQRLEKENNGLVYKVSELKKRVQDQEYSIDNLESDTAAGRMLKDILRKLLDRGDE